MHANTHWHRLSFQLNVQGVMVGQKSILWTFILAGNNLEFWRFLDLFFLWDSPRCLYTAMLTA